MLKYFLPVAILLASCTRDGKRSDHENHVFLNDTSIIKSRQIDGLWREYKHEYESSYVLIQNDTVYFLKGGYSKYYCQHDTLMLISAPKNSKKVLGVNSKELIIINSSHDTIRLKREL